MKNNINNTLLCSQSCELSTFLCFVIKENIFCYVFARNPEKISCLSRTYIWNSNVLGDTWKWFLQSNVLTLVESLVTHIQDAVLCIVPRSWAGVVPGVISGVRVTTDHLHQLSPVTNTDRWAMGMLTSWILCLMWDETPTS